MEKNKFFLIISTIILLSISFVYSDDGNISMTLYSDKDTYEIGENVSLFLRIENGYNTEISGQIKGKVLIGDVGYEIQCFDYASPANISNDLGLTPLIATMSNSNRKTLTTLYSCGGTNMRSTKTVMDNTPVTQSGSEVFEIEPFRFEYSYNGTDYISKSNSINITVTASNQNQQQSQQQNQQQNSNNQQQEQNTNNNQQQNQQQNSQNQNPNNQQQSGQSGSNSMQQNGMQNNNQQNIDPKTQNSLTNNQQNSQTVNQLKKDIQNVKNSILNPHDMEKEEKRFFWIWFLILIIAIAGMIFLYYRFMNKNEEIIEEEPPIIENKDPEYLLLLDEAENSNDNKEKAMLISQAIRNYIAISYNVEEELTHRKAISLTNNKFFKELLEKTEMIEFARKNIELDYKTIIKKLRKTMSEDDLKGD